MKNNNRWFSAVSIFAVVLLSGCGGGGGGSPSAPAPPPVPPPPSNNAPSVASANVDQSATEGEEFNYDATQGGVTFNDSDGDPLTYSITFSPDSNGFSASGGDISGTPQSIETTTVTITADDGNGGTVSDTFTITTEAAANNAPVVAAANAAQAAIVGIAFSYDATQGEATFSDSDNDTLIYSVSFSPDANGFSANNGQITGAPENAETTTVTITADDGNGGTASDSFIIQATTAGTITISGRITYDYVPHNPLFNGLDYDNTQVLPVRGATVQLIDSAGIVRTTGGVTDSDGNYSLNIAETASTVRVRVRAELANFGSGWQVRVVDNTSGGALYVLDGGQVASGNVSSVRNLHAESGWGGSSYSSTRAAAPFAILQNVYDSMQLVRSVDTSATFTPLTINWSENNRPAQGNVAVGEIGTSFFRQVTTNNEVTNEIFILGAEDNDTDEYDRHIVVHEWGHYFEANFSRSDSIGGPHGDGDRLDMRVAFGEGWGTALAAMVLRDTDYRDTFGNDQASVGGFDIEDNTVTNPGWYSEASMWTILYDLFDDSNEGSVDSVSLGFEPIYQVMINQQRTTPLFTSIFTFITALKEDNPGSVSAINALVAHHNIEAATIDAEGSTEVDNAGNSNALPIYTELPLDGATVNLCMDDTFGTSNKLANTRYLKFSIASQGNYRIEAARSPEGTVAGDPDFFVYSSGTLTAVAGSGVANSETRTITDLPAGDYVVEFREFNFFDDITPRDGESCYNITLTTQ